MDVKNKTKDEFSQLNLLLGMLFFQHLLLVTMSVMHEEDNAYFNPEYLVVLSSEKFLETVYSC